VARMLIVSADSHITPPPSAVFEYLEADDQHWIREYLDENEAWHRTLRCFRFPQDVLDVIDDDMCIRTHGDLGWDRDRRLREMDREGVAAELLLAGTNAAAPPFFSCANRVYPADVRLAGCRAYHRWVADVTEGARDRLIGVAVPGPCLDMEQALGDLRWVADRGFRSVGVPGIVADAQLPPLRAPYYEPFWQACVELDMVLSVHALHGRPQGELMPLIERVTAHLGDAATPYRVQEALDSGEFEDSPSTPDLVPQRVFWELMIGGVFDRHPKLRIAFTELRAAWLPATLRTLDAAFARGEVPAARRPSEYWQQHCTIGCSSITPSEIRLRHEIGVDRMMFGRDYPHARGTWPNTLDWLRVVFADVAEDEARAILGENAVRWYGLDREHLTAIAARIGPEPGDLYGDHAVDDALVATFATRGGFARSTEEVGGEALQELVGA
jgi:predicted TIM-barrel fold metal-dependent hydrolase